MAIWDNMGNSGVMPENEDELFADLEVPSKAEEQPAEKKVIGGTFGIRNVNNHYSAPVSGKEDLIGKLTKYRDLLGECEELQRMIRPQNDLPQGEGQSLKPRSFFRYFWPFILIAIGSFYVLYFIGTILTTWSRFDSISSGSPAGSAAAIGDLLIYMVLGAVVAAAVIFFGVKVSKAKQKKYNDEVEYLNMQDAARLKESNDNQRLLNLFQENVQKMYQYEQLVPEKYRSYMGVDTIIELLKQDKAGNVEEACALFTL